MTDHPVVPQKLQAAGYRFIRLLPKTKDPVEREYTTVHNYLATEPQITTWIQYEQSFELKARDDSGLKVHFEGYGNYGVLCTDSLIALDFDRQDIIDHALLHPLIKGAFMAQSGSGEGLHVYIRTTGAKITKLSDQETKENIGHIKAKGSYVVGPGCIHPSGGLYRVINDGEIPEIPFDELLEYFSAYIEKKEAIPPRAETSSYYRPGDLSVSIPVEYVLPPIKPVKNGNEIQGGHPVHGSKGGKNFSVNTKKNTWFCHRCGTGGGPLEAIAVRHGLLQCSDIHPGCLRGEVFKQVLDIAEDTYGWTRPIKTTPSKPTILPEPDSGETFNFDVFQKSGIQTGTLPEELPDADAILIDGYPRIGKSHWSEVQAIKHGTANIIANTHSVIEQHLRIFRENRRSGMTAVHLEGRNRCCLYGDERKSCGGCSHYPYTSDPADRGHFLAYVGETLHDEEILTTGNTPEEYCPYFFLKEAAKIADFVYTVPDNLEEITGESHQARHLTIIDEDTCFASFFPQSVDLAEFIRGPTRNTVVNLVEIKWVGIQKWKDYVMSGKRPKGKKTILRMIEILENIREILRIKDDAVFTPSEIIHEVSLVDLEIPEPEDITKPELLRLIERWEIPDTFSPFAKALLYPYEERTLDWQGYNPMKLRLIANEVERIYDPPNTKMILIGSTRAEMFLKTLKDTRYEAIRINKFQYSKNFVFFVIKGKSEEKGRVKKQNYKNIVRSAMKKVAMTNSTTRYPLLALVGTKKEQANLMEDLGGICKGSSDENITGQRWNYIGGFFNIFYQNSVISRGVDIPFYKTLVAYSSDFANPYWTARHRVAIDNKDDADVDYTEAIIDAITVDETTNSILRITPVIGHTDTTPRVVIIGEKDFWKVKPGVTSEAQVAEVEAEKLFDNLEKILNMSGSLEILPERGGDIDEFGHETIHWYVDEKHGGPSILNGMTVEEKGKFYVQTILDSDAGKDAWKRNYRPDIIKRVETAVTRYLITRDKEGKTIRFDALKNYISKQNKRFRPTMINDVIMGMYKSGIIRIDNIAKDNTNAVVRISSVYVDNNQNEANATNEKT